MQQKTSYGNRTSTKGKPIIRVQGTHELIRAIDACNVALSHMPSKVLTCKRAERIARDLVAKKRRESQRADFHVGSVKLLAGDLADRGDEIPDDSVDLVLTDPLYTAGASESWRLLSRFSCRVLRPGGLLVAYSGCYQLRQLMTALDDNLSYLSLACIPHNGQKQLVHATRLFSGFKPLLIYHKPPLTKYWQPFCDTYSAGRAKEYHEYEQPAEEARYFIKALCPCGGTICDPMMGSGSTIVGALQSGLGLSCIGIERDAAAFAAAQQRIEQRLRQLGGISADGGGDDVEASEAVSHQNREP